MVAVAISAWLKGLFKRFRQGTLSVDIRWVIVGLGNPEEQYRDTRHNIGFAVIDHLAAMRTDVRFRRQAGACYARIESETGGGVLLVKPLTYMNRSGEAVVQMLRDSGVTAGSCLVVVDDLNLPVGSIRFRRNGSDGGHNGLKSVIEHIGDQFPRLRIGIGPVPPGINAREYVLGRFGAAERTVVDAAIRRAAEGVKVFVQGGIDQAMNAFN